MNFKPGDRIVASGCSCGNITGTFVKYYENNIHYTLIKPDITNTKLGPPQWENGTYYLVPTILCKLTIEELPLSMRITNKIKQLDNRWKEKQDIKKGVSL